MRKDEQRLPIRASEHNVRRPLRDVDLDEHRYPHGEVALLENLLPRHMQIIYLINALHLDAQRNAGHDDDAFQRLAHLETILASDRVPERNHSARSRHFIYQFLI